MTRSSPGQKPAARILAAKGLIGEGATDYVGDTAVVKPRRGQRPDRIRKAGKPGQSHTVHKAMYAHT